MTRSLPVLLASAVLVTFIGACGESGKDAASSTPPVASTASVRGTTPVSSAAPNINSFKSDEDFDDHGDGNDDNPSDQTLSNSHSSDPDIDGDPLAGKTKTYYDSDDGIIRTFGHSAGTGDRQAITALVQRYYAAATASDGASACSLMYTLFAEAIPEDYAADVGLASSHTTCAAVMSKLFARNHGKLTGTIFVTSVRVKGNQAQATTGSTTEPASAFALKRERGAWKVLVLFPNPLP